MSLRRILTLDASSAPARVAVLDEESVLAEQQAAGPHGVADALPALARDCLAEAGMAAADLDAVAVIVGPGSFTGLRASIALACGLGLAAGIPVHGVGLGEAFAGVAKDRPLWIAVTARRGRVFLEREGAVASFAEDDLPRPEGPVAIAGERAEAVASLLAASGHDVLLTTARQPHPAGIARAIRLRHEAGLPPRPAVPLYVDPPEAKRPAQGLRPAPLPRI